MKNEYKINGNIYLVSKVEIVDDTDPKTIGMYDFDGKAIFLSENISRKEAKITLLHELIHGICKEFKIKLSAAEEERLCEHGAVTLNDLFYWRKK